MWLPKHRMWATGRYREVGDALREDDLFRSGNGVAATAVELRGLEPLTPTLPV